MPSEPFEGLAALSIPWPLTAWCLRRVGRWEEADNVEDASDRRGSADSFAILKWLCILVVTPIAIFTFLAIPIHLSITETGIRVGHYASFNSDSFLFQDARRITVIHGPELKRGTSLVQDVIIDFGDGSRLRGNQVGDGGTNIRADVMQQLHDRSGLPLAYATSTDQIPALNPAR